MMRPWLIIIALGLCALAGFVGYMSGHRAATNEQEVLLAKAQQELFRAAELANRKEVERLALEQERNQLAMELEDAARNDPEAGRTSVGAAGVRRLNGR